MGVSERLAILMEGESLFNDAVAIVVFSVFLALATGSGGPMSITDAGLQFLRVFFGGIAVGLGTGLIFSILIKLLSETIIKALAIAGGPSATANLEKVHLTRETEAGVVAYKLDVERHLALGKPGAAFELQPGDTITVSAKSSFWSSMFRGFLAIAPVVTAISTVSIALK